MKRIVEPYKKGKTLMCNGEPIDASDVEKIKINETDEPSSVLLPRIKAEREAKIAESKVVVLGISNEWYVTEKGIDVTREFITAPPKRGRTFPKMPVKTAFGIISLIALSFMVVIVITVVYCRLMNLSFVEFARSNPGVLIGEGIILFGILAGIRYRR